jgi:hypothetical protein
MKLLTLRLVFAVCPRDIISAFRNLNKKQRKEHKNNLEDVIDLRIVGRGILAAGEMSKVKDKWHDMEESYYLSAVEA